MRDAHADTSADAALAKMGYKHELPRNLSMLSILGLYVVRLFHSAIDFCCGLLAGEAIMKSCC